MDDHLVCDMYDSGEGRIVRKSLPHDFTAVVSCEPDACEYSNGVTREELDYPDEFYVIDLQVRMMRASIGSRLGCTVPAEHPRFARIHRAFEAVLREVNALSMEHREAMITGEVDHG